MTLLDGGASAIHAPSKVSDDSAAAVWLKKSNKNSRDKSGDDFIGRVLIIEVQIIGAGWLTGKCYVFSSVQVLSVQAALGTAKIPAHDNKNQY
ncbi:MAG: hypothetical protein OEY06_00485 [Gammaproteobacteria bacterium]|nr:hypothetical protein [Gammaproteobacteria bacterium]